jgi:5-oxoprolinase (ATP-hydrolysing) subunit B
MTDAPRIAPLRFSDMGEDALLCDAASNSLLLEVQEKIWNLAELAKRWPNIREVVPGMNNLLIVYDSMLLDPTVLARRVSDAWQNMLVGRTAGRTVDVPVRYGGDAGVDLAYVADHCGLSVGELVSLHAAGEYVVYAIGSQPGFGYLGGMDGRLTTPRRAVPRTRVEAGCVVIGGAQTGVISCSSPSGWHIIGRTDVRFFDPAREPAVWLAPGDRVRFLIEDVKP